MTKEIAVSIIIPVYNAEKTIVQCLDSVVGQTLKNIEIIIIDDGSTDSSGEICRRYQQEDGRIKYFYKKNEGLAAARQDGIEKANGEYVGFVDSDDWLELKMYERMYEVAYNAKADIVFCNCYFDNSEKDRIHLEPRVYNRVEIEENILPRTLAEISCKGNNSVIRWSNCLRIYRRELLIEKSIKFDRRFRRSQDLQLTFEATLHANTYVSINNEYLYHNRTVNNAGSLSRGYTRNYWELICPLIDKLYSQVNLYKKQNLSNQMHLCTFFFAATGVKNEYENKKHSITTRIKKIKHVANDLVVQDALPYIEYDKLSEYYRMIYQGLLSKSAVKVFISYFIYNMKKEVIKPIVRRMLNNKQVGKIYQILKGK